MKKMDNSIQFLRITKLTKEQTSMLRNMDESGRLICTQESYKKLLSIPLETSTRTSSKSTSIIKQITHKDKKAIVQMHKEAVPLILDELEFSFTSQYPRRIYPLVKSGYRRISQKDLLAFADVPADFSESSINQKVMNPTVSALRKIWPDFKMQRIRDAKSYDYIFTHSGQRAVHSLKDPARIKSASSLLLDAVKPVSVIHKIEDSEPELQEKPPEQKSEAFPAPKTNPITKQEETELWISKDPIKPDDPLPSLQQIRKETGATEEEARIVYARMEEMQSNRQTIRFWPAYAQFIVNDLRGIKKSEKFSKGRAVS